MTNAEKYKTVEERTEKFVENCIGCVNGYSTIRCTECQFKWLEQEEEKLKPCPFCGGKAEYIDDFDGKYIECTVCRAIIFPKNRKNEKEVVEFWNERAGENND